MGSVAQTRTCVTLRTCTRTRTHLLRGCAGLLVGRRRQTRWVGWLTRITVRHVVVAGAVAPAPDAAAITPITQTSTIAARRARIIE
jgi:hypothetical protein